MMPARAGRQLWFFRVKISEQGNLFLMMAQLTQPLVRISIEYP